LISNAPVETVGKTENTRLDPPLVAMRFVGATDEETTKSEGSAVVAPETPETKTVQYRVMLTRAGNVHDSVEAVVGMPKITKFGDPPTILCPPTSERMTKDEMFVAGVVENTNVNPPSVVLGEIDDTTLEDTAKSVATPDTRFVAFLTVMIHVIGFNARGGDDVEQLSIEAGVGVPWIVKGWMPLVMASKPTLAEISKEVVRRSGVVEKDRMGPPNDGVGTMTEISEEATTKSEGIPVVGPFAPTILMVQVIGEPWRWGVPGKQVISDAVVGTPYTKNDCNPLVMVADPTLTLIT
jgi:hypothetical protein